MFRSSSARVRPMRPAKATVRIGEILIGRGRDATDVAISTSFGLSKLVDFKVFTDEEAGWERPQAQSGGRNLPLQQNQERGLKCGTMIEMVEEICGAPTTYMNVMA